MSDQPHLSGQTLYGDDLAEEALRRWFEDEEEGYYGLAAGDGAEYSYGYHRLNHVHAFRHLADRRFGRCLAIGCARGDELAPVSAQIDEIVCLEPAEKWWSDRLHGRPATYLKPSHSGGIPLADASVDLILCLGVLHHIPNVSYVLRELARVAAPGAIALIREPVHSMGDWRKPRPGLTRHERGIPSHWFVARLREAGFRIVRQAPCVFPALARIGQRAGVGQPYNSRLLVALDSLVSRLTAWNDHYHRDTFLKKLAPSSIYFLVEREGGPR